MMAALGSFEEIRLSFTLDETGGTSAAGLSSIASRLRTFCFDALRLAGRVALTQLRSVVEPCRAIPTAFRTDCLNVIQRLPSAVRVVAYSLPVRIGHRRLLDSGCHKTPERSANVQILFAGFANDHG